MIRQPKRRALLAYLAVEYPGRFCRRDTLLAMFWPEEDLASGRNSLNQTLYGLRKELGNDVIISRGKDEVGLNPSYSFDTAELLRNLHLPSLPDFEEWAARQQVTPQPKARTRRYASIALIASIALVAHSSNTVPGRSVLVLPFNVEGGSDALGVQVTKLLEQRAHGDGVVRGTVVAVKDRLEIDAALYDVDGKLIRRAHSLAGDANDLAELVDQVAAKLF